MYLIRELQESDVLHKKISNKNVRYRLRKAARGLVFHEKNIAILHAGNLHLHKLPGGGIENEESIAEGFNREILEETGFKVGNSQQLGITIEYRDEIELIQISYVFIADIAEKAGLPKFTQKEIDEGFVLKWLSVPEAIGLLKDKDAPKTYAGKFIHARDLAILEYFQHYEKKENNY